MEALILLSKEESLAPGERRRIRDLLRPGGGAPTARAFRALFLPATALRWLAWPGAGSAVRSLP